MFEIVRVFDDGDSTTFRYIAAKFDTKAGARNHRAKLQSRFPRYTFLIAETSQGTIKQIRMEV